MEYNKFLILPILGLTFLISCDKMKAKKYEGTYTGVKVTESWIMGGATTTSTESSTLVITRNKQYLSVGDWVFDVGELDADESYQGGVSNYLKFIQFDGNSVYFSSSNGSLGGGTSYNFTGNKED